MSNANENSRVVHIVESHLGGTYLSSADLEVIESFCERCGDSDCIVGSFPADDAKAAFVAITAAYTKDLRLEVSAYSQDDQLDPQFVEYAQEEIDDLCSADALTSYFDMLDVSAGRAPLMHPPVHESVRKRFLAQGADLKASLASMLDTARRAKRDSHQTA